MGKTLVVVESPAKAKTIKKYLGAGYEVLASKGHIKDLPTSTKFEKKPVIDVKNGFQEIFTTVEGKEKVIAEIKAAAKDADEVLLATDPDREGEAIAYHIADVIASAKKPSKRVEFHEITKKGVQHGVSHPRALNKSLYDAQRARRVLDRIVGYDVSAVVWSKLAFGLSAGRVQSVALRLIVDREREIQAFVPEEYWNVGVALQRQAEKTKKGVFRARLANYQGKKIAVTNGETAGRVREHLEKAAYKVSKLTKSERKRHSPAPYTTSKLQQDAVSRLGFTAKRTMQIAQNLYEGVDLGKDGGPVGLITYMRTDSVRSSPEAVAQVREFIGTEYGKAYVPSAPRAYKSKKNSQDAHEAIRPTSLDLPPDLVRKHLKDEQYKLYRLIWQRFVASQMNDAVFDQTSVEIEAAAGSDVYGLRASGRTLKFAGWLEVYGVTEDTSTKLAGEEDQKEEGAEASLEGDDEDASLPELTQGEGLARVTPPGVITEQKFTQPPARYSEGSLVKELEERGIGRPSTYAEIINKVQARDYVEKIDGGRFKPTDLGCFIVDGLVKGGMAFMEPEFTSEMEVQLDEVEAGKADRVDVLGKFYERFQKQLEKLKATDRWGPSPEDTGEACPKCLTGRIQKRWSKFGFYEGCSNYADKKIKCDYKKDLGADGKGANLPEITGVICDACGKPMSVRGGRYGAFLSCTGYPACKQTRPLPLGVPCPKCGGDLIEVKSKKRGARTFYGCVNYAKEGVTCDFKLWQKPIAEPCPGCGAKFLVMGGTKGKPLYVCADKECGFKKPAPAPMDEAAEA